MKNILKEVEIQMVKSQMGDYPIARLKGRIPYEIGKRMMDTYNMKYNKIDKFFYWWLDKNDPAKSIEKNIRPALAYLNSIKETIDLTFEIEDLIAALDGPTEAIEKETGLSAQEQEDVKTKLELFKKKLVNISDDEDFKETMGNLIKFKAAQGYTFSLINSMLIKIQRPNARIVNSKQNWLDKYNRTVDPKAKPLMVWVPKGKNQTKSKEQKEKETNEFIKTVGKSSYDELTPNEKIKLDTKIRGKMFASNFQFGKVYDVADTVQIEGKEDYVTGALDALDNVKWFEEGMLDDAVRPIYQSLLKFCADTGISVDFSDDLGGARGVSKNGKITLLTNEGNDVGTTKTFAHEIAHELLHQTYVKMTGKIDFYVGRDKSDNNQTVEQQAEISAWMFMYAFGFDVKTTSLNYTLIWGGNPTNMVTVFETVSKMVNYLIDYVNSNMGAFKTDMKETMGSATHGNHITPEEIANRLGISKEYNMVKDKLEHKDDKTELYERLIRKVLK